MKKRKLLFKPFYYRGQIWGLANYKVYYYEPMNNNVSTI